MKKEVIFTGVILMTLCSSLFAMQRPRSLATDSRIKVVAFRANDVVPINATTFTTTQIVFSKDEYIQNIQNGDMSAWTSSVQKALPNMLFIKPTILGSNTNMEVVTNKHTYYFHLLSNRAPRITAKGQTYAVKFIYPAEEQAKLLKRLNFDKQQKKAIVNSSRNPNAYNWDYSFNGSRRIAPMHVFDDGKFTYMLMQSNQPIPAVFAVDNTTGNESVVNFRRRGNYIVIQRVAPQFTLRVGKSMVASIFNNRAISRMGY